MSSFSEDFEPFVRRMKEEHLPDSAIENFRYYYRKLREGESGFIPESDIVPVESLPDAEALSSKLKDIGKQNIRKTVMIKLNGGLGTSMGLNKAKSLLTAKNSFSFLDIIIQQAVKLKVPAIFMNSFSTREDTLKALKRHPDLWGDLPADFMQYKVPKVDQTDLSPVSWPGEPNLEWCPPGHGEIYMALVTSGMLDKLLAYGYTYAFVSNADNLGAGVDLSILGYFVQNALPFMMEAADRTEADSKGGHLARLKTGQYVLREIAQCPEEDKEAFQDIERHKYFNSNNVWLNLQRLKDIMETRNHVLGLPMIRNSKTVDPREPSSTPVFQLETAMGAAISVFDGAGAIRIPRTRFAPVKDTNDLLALRSDSYVLTTEFQVAPNPKRTLPPIVIDLDPRYYKFIDDFEARFPFGAPSLRGCESLTIRGKFRFGPDVTLEGCVKLINDKEQEVGIEANERIKGEFRA